jgi:hypothetical protein
MGHGAGCDFSGKLRSEDCDCSGERGIDCGARDGEGGWRGAWLISGFPPISQRTRNGWGTELGAISAENSAVKILIVPANEELIVAREAVKVVGEALG